MCKCFIEECSSVNRTVKSPKGVAAVHFSMTEREVMGDMSMMSESADVTSWGSDCSMPILWLEEGRSECVCVCMQSALLVR